MGRWMVFLGGDVEGRVCVVSTHVSEVFVDWRLNDGAFVHASRHIAEESCVVFASLALSSSNGSSRTACYSWSSIVSKGN
jgi:hypothetical protein